MLLGEIQIARHSSSGRCFTSLCYSADGQCILAGGRTKFVCIYQAKQRVLLKRFVISENLSLDGTRQFLNSSNMGEGGPLSAVNDDDDSEDVGFFLAFRPARDLFDGPANSPSEPSSLGFRMPG